MPSAGGQQEVEKAWRERGGLVARWLVPHRGLWGCFCSGQRPVSGERNFGSGVAESGGKKAERQHGAFDVLMHSMLLCNSCSSKAEGHLRFIALDLGQYRNCLIFP